MIVMNNMTQDPSHYLLEKAKQEGAREERQFILNILDGIDEADRQMGNKNGGTKAIRQALESRIYIMDYKMKTSTVNIRMEGDGYIIDITDTPTDQHFAITRDELEQIVLYGQAILKTS